MSVELTFEFFQKHTVYYLQGPNGESIPLSLLEAKHLGEIVVPGDWGEPETNQVREQFSIVIRGPHSPRLSQGTFEFALEDGTPIGPIFIVPIAQDSKGFVYEIAFS